MPQTFDIDLMTYQVSDKAAKGIEGAGSAVTGAFSDAVKANWKPLALVGGIGLGGYLAARKLHLV